MNSGSSRPASTIDVAIAADANYVQHAAVVARTLIDHHPQHCVRLHFVHSGTTPPEVLAPLVQMLESSGHRFIDVRVPPSWADRLKPHPYFGTHAWMRMLLPELLPELDRVLYLDSDVVICDSLDALWQQDLGTAWVGAVVNPLYPHQPLQRLAKIGIHQREHYFNSGVLLMDLATLRRERVCDALMAYADQMHEELLYPDQDVLNAVLAGRWMSLHPRYNAQSPIYDLSPRELPLAPHLVREARRDPAIVHFSGLFKPWMDACGHPLRKRYWKALERTPWRGAKPQNPYWRNKILRYFPYRLYYWYWQRFPQPQAQRSLTTH